MRGRRGFTLLEVMVSVAIISLIGVLIYGAFTGMHKARSNVSSISDRYQQGRQAIDRMSRELVAAYISNHKPTVQNQSVRQTAFIGHDQSSGDRLDFSAFAGQRLSHDSHVSDQAEISYFLADNPDTGGRDLVRRISRNIDDDVTRGGLVQVMAENVESFDVVYLDPTTNEWTATWDTLQPTAQPGRLPSQVWITLKLAGGPLGRPVKFETKVVIPIQLPLDFANK
ncbi:MAG: prepilin-type N-terminal cleavage/methylation domain-containing protein [Myxococcales bacterium]|nr:prepilin-type N-terminal cleavage/methylation domain-containing protein [Myxococcales bacterium]